MHGAPDSAQPLRARAASLDGRGRAWKRLGRALCLAAAIAALGCAGSYYLAPDAPPVTELRNLLLLPPNFAQVPPNSWVDGLDRLTAHLESHLEATGHDVRRLPMSEVLSHWREATAAVEGVVEVVEGSAGE